MSSKITFTGLGSDLDTAGIIDSLMEAESYRQTDIETDISNYELRQTIVENIDTYVASLLTQADKIRSSSNFYSRVATTSNSNVASIAVDSTAETGNYSLTVSGATKNIIAGTNGVSSTDDVIATTDGTFAFTDGNGVAVSVDVAAGTTLEQFEQQLESAINTAGSNAQVSLIDDGSGTNRYRLAITGAASGSGHDVDVTSDSTNLNFTGNHVDDVEEVKWSGSTSGAVSVDNSSYSGSVSKRFTFSVSSGGTVGTDKIRITWVDSVEGTTGTMTVDKAGEFEVRQGVKLNFAEGATLATNSTFAVDAYVPTVQQAQDEGLAKAEKEVHFGHADANTTPVTNTAGYFSFTYNGTATGNISVAAGATLNDLCNAINTAASNTGVKATIVNDGKGASNSYHLVLTSKNTGAAYTIEDINYSLDNFSSEGFTQVQRGQNSMIQVDGYPTGDTWLQRSSNLISDAVSGASITLTSTGTTQFSVSNDTDEMMSKVTDFVDSYNELVDYLGKISEVKVNDFTFSTASDDDTDTDTEDTDESAIFAGDYSVRQMQSKLSGLVTGHPLGFDADTDRYMVLASIGISLNDDNQLEIDESTLEQALTNYPSDVVDFLTANKEGVTDHSQIYYGSGLSTTKAGTYDVEVNYNTDGTVASARYRNQGADTWYNLTVENGNTLTASSGDAKGMSLTAVSDGSGQTITAEVRIKEGKFAQFYSDVLDYFDSDDGITANLLDSYSSTLETLNDNLSTETTRLTNKRTYYENKYANLETVMSNYNSQLETLQSMLSSLSSSSS